MRQYQTLAHFTRRPIVSGVHKDVNNMEVETQTNTCMGVNDVY